MDDSKDNVNSFSSLSDLFHLVKCIICSSLSNIKTASLLVTNSSGEAWIDTEWNGIWQVIKKCFGMLRALWAGPSTPRSRVEDIRPEVHAK